MMGILLSSITLICSINRRGSRNREDILIRVLMIITLTASIVETVSFMVDGRSGPFMKILNYFSNSLLYVAVIALLFVFVLYVLAHIYGDWLPFFKKRFYLFIFPLLLLAGIFWNLFFPFIFSIDSENVYHRLLFSSAYYLGAVYMALVGYGIAHKFRKTSGKLQFFPLQYLYIPVIIGTVLQFMFYGIATIWCCASIGVCGLFMSLQNNLAYIDSLTGIYNRAFLDSKINIVDGTNKKIVGMIMTDVNLFKRINDEYGHSEGYFTSVAYAGILRSAIGDKGVAIRYAGDEFIIMQNTSDLENLEKTVRAVKELCEEFNGSSGKPYPLSGAFGCGIFDPSAESYDSFFNKIDMLMYKDKASFYATHKEYDRRR